MRTTNDVFHLAIPVGDLDEAQHFYVTLVGCKLARRYPDRITVDFFGDQLVCHLSEITPQEGPISLYPRHFGVTFHDRPGLRPALRVSAATQNPFLPGPLDTVRGPG